MKRKEFENYEEKDKMEKMGLFLATMKYITEQETMQDVLNNIDDIYIKEEKIKNDELAGKMNYYGDKIIMAAQLLSLKKIFENKKEDDLITILNYIQVLVNKARSEVMNCE